MKTFNEFLKSASLEEIETANMLAAQLHREYRAAEKAMRNRTSGKGSLNILLHDHGWEGCSNTKYFHRRAVKILQRSQNLQATCLMEAEEALQAQVLKRRLIVGLK